MKKERAGVSTGVLHRLAENRWQHGSQLAHTHEECCWYIFGHQKRNWHKNDYLRIMNMTAFSSSSINAYTTNARSAVLIREEREARALHQQRFFMTKKFLMAEIPLRVVVRWWSPCPHSASLPGTFQEFCILRTEEEAGPT